MPPLRFKLNIERCIQGVQLLAAHKPGITQYYIGKTFFFADKKHLFDWGRPISGDRYVAMEHGPVPSAIYDLLKSDSGVPDEIVSSLYERIRTVANANRIQVFSVNETPLYPALARTDQEYLLEALSTYGNMGFGELKRLSHEDPAYEAAWALSGLNNELDLRLWFKHNEKLLEEIYETAPVRRRA